MEAGVGKILLGVTKHGLTFIALYKIHLNK
jgi:hypothetical protein